MLKVIKNKPMPDRSGTLQKEDYLQAAEAMEVGDCVETGGKTATVGLLRALERMDRIGSQRKIGDSLWVWRRS